MKASVPESRVRRELNDLRYEIMCDLGVDYQDTLMKIALASTYEGIYQNLANGVSAILDQIFEEKSYSENILGQKMVKCPLCRRRSAKRHYDEFTFPEGLRRHLLGFGGRVRQCLVIKAAINYGKDKLDAKISSIE